MQIIPVIDIKNGLVVHAHQGNRESYQPIKSSLCNSAQPQAVIDAFLTLHTFSTLYIADLDLLSAAGNNTQLIHSLLEQFPQIQFWIDQGILYHHTDQLANNWIQVIGSESLSESMLPVMSSKPADLILSLDFKQSLIGSNQLLKTTQYWPEQVIVMTLTRVGTNTGPDWERLKKIQQMTTQSRLTAAGGIRGVSDLNRLTEMGIHSALLASCLHNGQLCDADIQKLAMHCQ
jgi:phosphoribosylformimino-5-aminoimidazole carboxamide ribotide isomerase